jgi:hypothetical protein
MGSQSGRRNSSGPVSLFGRPALSWCYCWSGWPDLNRRPLRPESQHTLPSSVAVSCRLAVRAGEPCRPARRSVNGIELFAAFLLPAACADLQIRRFPRPCAGCSDWSVPQAAGRPSGPLRSSVVRRVQVSTVLDAVAEGAGRHFSPTFGDVRPPNGPVGSRRIRGDRHRTVMLLRPCR